MNLAKILALLVTVINNKELWEAIKKIIEFLKTLSPEKQTAFATFVNTMTEEEQESYFMNLMPASKSFGATCPCPDCPDDCKDVEDELKVILAE